MRTRTWIFLLFPSALLWGCQTHPNSSLRVQDNTLRPISFEYALLNHAYSPTDSSTQAHFYPHTAERLSLLLKEPTFVAIRHANSPQTYLLLLSPTDEALLTLHPISYEVAGSQESHRVWQLYKILRQLNDSIARLNQQISWITAPTEGEQTDSVDFQPRYDALLQTTREALKRFVIDAPYSKANLVALAAKFDGKERFFDTPELRPLARVILQDLATYYQDADFAQQLLTEYAGR